MNVPTLCGCDIDLSTDGAIALGTPCHGHAMELVGEQRAAGDVEGAVARLTELGANVPTSMSSLVPSEPAPAATPAEPVEEAVEPSEPVAPIALLEPPAADVEEPAVPVDEEPVEPVEEEASLVTWEPSTHRDQP